MYFVTQTNKVQPRRGVCNGYEEAMKRASDLCPDPGDKASVYKLTRVATVEAITTIITQDETGMDV